MSTYYVVNKTDSHLLFKNGYVTIQRGAYKEVSQKELDSEEYLLAKDRGWISVSATKPNSADLPVVKAIEFVEPNRGMSAEELQKMLKEEAEAEAKPVAKTEAFGQSKVEETQEENKEAPVSEKKSSRSKKA